jgi:aminoglycoside phosphotransferase (APT) family kinase protein
VSEERAGELITERIGERIGIGRTAEVYRFRDGQVVKLLLPGFPDEMGETEAAIGELVNAAVSAAPRFLGTTRIDGRLGLLYELVEGPNMLDQLTSRPWSLLRLADELAALHAAMHDADGSGLRSMRSYLGHMIGEADGVARPDMIAAAHRRIDALPDGRAVCHGDMHPGNVIRAEAGPVVIDWMTARAGPPEADVARTLFLLAGSAVPSTIPPPRRWLISGLRRAYAARYLHAYHRLRRLDPLAVRGWRLPILVARLGEGIEEEREPLLAVINAELRQAR